ncbi:S8 family serine peptidase [Halostella sp. JP-L12]|uniref:S8 family serine peptidase n=1 Tax=Halostella TaxID=1843185 RepID=UPI000EF8369E|nr:MULTISPECIES: S8 family serine peptidase [Halostella]NHN48380.1 S8 family serine peptidase [Halostella sp. JP-L12]
MSNDGTPSWSRRSFLKTTGAMGAAGALGGVASATPGRPPGPREDEILVGVSAASTMDDVQAQVEREIPDDAEVVHRNETLGYMAVRLPDRASTQARESVKSAMANRNGVRYAEDNATYHALAQPNDPRYGDQYAPQQVNAPAAWDTTLGSENVTVAVVDQGVKYDHPDLADQFGANKGRDFVDDDGDPYPTDMSNEYHGTHVAGIAAATTNNGTGIAGMSNSRLLSARALSPQSGGSTADIADAVQWAADQGADVINMSLGGGGYTSTMKNAVSYATSNGSLVVCAAGNDGSRGVSYPAAYDETVAVSALDQNEDLADFSQYGDKVDVAAPGVDVLSAWTTSDYNRISGTSMACPAAAGVAALGKAVDSSLSATELRQRLKETAVDVGLSADRQGAGRVDAANIVGTGGGNESPTVSIDASSASVAVGEEVTFDGSGSDDPDGTVVSYEWNFGDGTSATGEVVTKIYDATGEYTVSLRVTDDQGASTTDSVAVTVGDGGGNCGAETDGGSADGTLSGYYDSDSYSYAARTSAPCQITVSLDGPSGADFDLYVTLDGRTPTTSDYDKRSITQDSQETVVVDDVDSSTELGILVDSYSGSGSYTLSIEEVGR